MKHRQERERNKREYRREKTEPCELNLTVLVTRSFADTCNFKAIRTTSSPPPPFFFSLDR